MVVAQAGGQKNRKIAGPKPFVPPPPLKGYKCVVPPPPHHTVWPKLQAPVLKLPQNLCVPPPPSAWLKHVLPPPPSFF